MGSKGTEESADKISKWSGEETEESATEEEAKTKGIREFCTGADSNVRVIGGKRRVRWTRGRSG